MAKAVYTGSFDPPTLGHVDIIRRALGIFDELHILVSVNPNKKPLFSDAERVELLKEIISNDPELRDSAHGRVQIVKWPGLVVSYTEEFGGVIVRGVRSASEFEAESTMALLNKQLTGVETVLLIADPTLGHISSSMVKEIASFGGSVQGMVPDLVAAAMQQKYNSV